MKSILYFATGIACLLACASGCTVQTVHPLEDAGRAVRDSGLVGRWNEPDSPNPDKDYFIEISADDEGNYHCHIAVNDYSLNYVGHLIEVANERYLEVVAEKRATEAVRTEDTTIKTFLFVKVSRDGDSLTLCAPDYHKLKAAVQRGELQGIFTDGRLVLTSPADVITSYLQSNEKDIFAEPRHLKRVQASLTN
jgi:hypothetical protein